MNPPLPLFLPSRKPPLQGQSGTPFTAPTTGLDRRSFLKLAGSALAGVALPGCTEPARESSKYNHTRKPNFVIIFCDDLGYGDLGCFGSQKHRTPNIDNMAAEGTRLTSFYVTSGVCTPSRASLMTGCYPRRVNLHRTKRGEWVLFPTAPDGLNPNEITIAEVLKQAGYATACIGKWHLGDQPQFLPTRQGFDYYFGIPYSNDMGERKDRGWPPLPLLRNETVIEAPVDQNTITRRYTSEAVNFITQNKDRPFFLYLPHTMPHDPHHSSEKFRGKSANGPYGDAVEEIDFSTGQILNTLNKLRIDDRTLVIFTSDNGAAKNYPGSNAPLSGHKGSTWEGGMRVPCVARWPGKIPPRKTCDELASTIDLLPTFAKLAATTAPTDRIIDGRDIWPLLSGGPGAKSPHEAFYYYYTDQLHAVRSGPWKLHLPLSPKIGGWRGKPDHTPPFLYDVRVDQDPGEIKDLAKQHPDIVKRLTALAQKAAKDLGDLDRQGHGQRPSGLVTAPKPLLLNAQNGG